MKTIVIVTSTIYPDMGGGELYMFNLAKELTKEFSVNVLCITHELGVGEYQEIQGVKIYYLSHFKALGPAFPSPIGVFKKLNKINPDIIYTSGPGVHDFFVTFFNIFFRKKMIMTYHGTHNPTTLSKIVFTKFYFIWIFRFYTSIIVTTDKYFNILKSKNIQNVHLVPCGVEKYKLNTKINLNKKKKRSLLFVAMLTENHKHKRLPILLKAMKSLPNYTLDIIGDGNLKTKYEKIAKELGLQNAVFHGKKTGNELKSFYEASSIFILPSNSGAEGFGIVLLEALGNGCKIILGEKCGGAFLVKNNPDFGGLYNGEVSELVKTIKNVENSSSLDMEFIEQFLSQFYWENVAKQIIKTFNVSNHER